MTPLHETQKVICAILGRKKSRNMCQNAFFPCLQGIRILGSKREEQKTDVWSAKKFTAHFKILFTKNLNLIIVNKKLPSE